MKKQTISSEHLSIILATAYTLHLNTQKFHWNISGSNFHPLHQLSETLYRELAENIDQLAERIRTCGYEAPASFPEFEKMTKIKTSLILNKNADEVIAQLLKNWEIFVEVIKESIEAIKKTDDEGTLAFLTDIVQSHEKNYWLIQSHLS